MKDFKEQFTAGGNQLLWDLVLREVKEDVDNQMKEILDQNLANMQKEYLGNFHLILSCVI